MVMAGFQNPALEDMQGEHKTSPIKKIFFSTGKVNVSIYQTHQALQIARGLAKIIGDVICRAELGAGLCTHSLCSDSRRGAVPSPAITALTSGRDPCSQGCSCRLPLSPCAGYSS